MPPKSRTKRAPLAEQLNLSYGGSAASYAHFPEGQENLPPPPPATKSRKRKSESSSADDATAPATKKSKSSSSSLSSSDPTDVSMVDLSPAIPIYDTCNEIRRKIKLFLQKPGVTQASFLRAISACTTDPGGRTISAGSLRSFLNQKTTRPGPLDGNTNVVYGPSYVFFEKVRLRDGKPKSKHREGMEDAWGPQGVDTDRPRNKFWVRKGQRAVMDQFGKVQIVGRGY